MVGSAVGLSVCRQVSYVEPGGLGIWMSPDLFEPVANNVADVASHFDKKSRTNMRIWLNRFMSKSWSKLKPR